MTQEEKLFKLLQVAVKNGFEFDVLKYPKLMLFAKLLNGTCKLEHTVIKNTDVWYWYSPSLSQFMFEGCLDYLVNLWEENEISFIESLCKTIIHCPYYDIIGNDEFEPRNIQKLQEADSYRIEWTLKPTSQRLNWLFETFNHLLKD